MYTDLIDSQIGPDVTEPVRTARSQCPWWPMYSILALDEA